jgi:hypothetical protein
MVFFLRDEASRQYLSILLSQQPSAFGTRNFNSSSDGFPLIIHLTFTLPIPSIFATAMVSGLNFVL